MPPQPWSCTTAGNGPGPAGRMSVASIATGAPGVALGKRTVSRAVCAAQPARSAAAITVAAVRCTGRAYQETARRRAGPHALR